MLRGDKLWILSVCSIMILIVQGCYDDQDAHTAHNPGHSENLDFNFHIRPLLSDRCYKCHGPDEATREAELRLDQREGAFATTSSDCRPVVPGSLSRSEIWQRINTDDPELMMPPPESGLILSQQEKDLIGRWIKEGAQWKDHWSFIPPQKPDVPLMRNGHLRNPIDHFIEQKLQEQGWTLQAEAEPERLIRRITMDLTGLPPSPEEVQNFVKDESSDAYEKVVDRLLASTAHAERLTMEWLDVARYADSHGLHADGIRMMWPWRDWVISAFQRNLPYHQFMTWQIAGDLLPSATREQKLATGFHRNHVTNSELGIVPEEFRLQYVADRTNTTAKVLMGLTTECASCHDHKFDPISMREYYQMTAFFNQVHELGMIGNDKNWGPMVMLPGPATDSTLKRIDTQIELVEQKVQNYVPDPDKLKSYISTLTWDKVSNESSSARYYPLDALAASSQHKNRQIIDRNKNTTASGNPELINGKVGKAIRIDNDYELIYLKGPHNFDIYEEYSAGCWLNFDEAGTFQTIMGNIGGKNDGWRGWIFYLDTLGRPGVRIVHSLSHNYLDVLAIEKVDPKEWAHLFFTYDGSTTAEGLKIYLNGAQLATRINFDHLYKNILPVKNRNYIPDYGRPVRMGKASQYLFSETDDGAFIGAYDEVHIFERMLTPLEILDIYESHHVNPSPLRELPHHVLQENYQYRKDQDFRDLSNELSKLRHARLIAVDTVQEVMVLADREKPRPTHILERGQYDRLGEEVQPGIPAALGQFDAELPKNRWGLAQWLFNPDHPLTARVTVNRYWQLIFGRGIVETTHDFGSQGALPSHPELLDWLAVSFIESGWNLRALLKMMLMSATYRQSSSASKEEIAADPDNIWLGRGPNYRWPAEMIRDNALAASGLLNRKIGGPSVKPYQPPDLWKEKNEFSGYLRVYEQDTGQALYRRSMYTFIRRTAPPPAMLTFDATDRANCVVKRERTNTPLQALVLMNDPQFVEAARALAYRVQKEGGNKLEDQINLAFRLLCGRGPNSIEMGSLLSHFSEVKQKFANDPELAQAFLSVGELKSDHSLDAIYSASLAMVSNTIMNFDEAYMKR